MPFLPALYFYLIYIQSFGIPQNIFKRLLHLGLILNVFFLCFLMDWHTLPTWICLWRVGWPRCDWGSTATTLRISNYHSEGDASLPATATSPWTFHLNICPQWKVFKWNSFWEWRKKRNFSIDNAHSNNSQMCENYVIIIWNKSKTFFIKMP